MVGNEYNPDYATPPGATLEETLKHLRMNQVRMNQAELAEHMGRLTKTVNEIIEGKAAITPAAALQLEKVTGIPAAFWNSRETRYREQLARLERRETERPAPVDSQLEQYRLEPYLIEMERYGDERDLLHVCIQCKRRANIGSMLTWKGLVCSSCRKRVVSEPDPETPDLSCTCKPSCGPSCKGECGCRACHDAYQDDLTLDWD